MRATPTASITATVDRISAVLVAAQLAPRTSMPYRGTLELYFTGPRPESVFGTATIGARTGRVLRAFLRPGNDGRSRHFTDGRALLRALRLLPGAVVRYRGSLAKHHGLYIVDSLADATGRIQIVDLSGEHHLRVTGPASLAPCGLFAQPHTSAPGWDLTGTAAADARIAAAVLRAAR